MEFIRNTNGLNAENVTELFRSVSWGSGLAPEQILAAVRASSHIVTAWKDGKLVGVARSMDDGVWSANIDCIIVHAGHQRQGIAGMMLDELLDMLKDVHYVSVSPNESYILPMYLKAGFRTIPEGSLLQLENKPGDINQYAN